MSDMKVLSIPAGHVYPAALRPRDGWPDIQVLEDPVIDPAEPDRWWPHPALRRDWWEREPRKVDLCHLHFGFEHLDAAETRDFVAVLAQRHIPLVLTIHDLDNPHLAEQRAFHQQLKFLTAAAAQVLTLSQGAAEIIRERYGRDALVVPHPAVVPNPPTLPGRPTPGVGVFLKSLRSNVVADPHFYRDLATGMGETNPLQFYLHREQADSDLARELTPARLNLHQPMDDHTLHDTIARHRVVVLPYLRGTHSGWLEMCLDLGVSVAVPDCGCYLSQAKGSPAVAQYRTAEGTDAARAVTELLRQEPPPPREHPFDNIAFHHQLYRALREGTLA